jgi:hypothetical protein
MIASDYIPAIKEVLNYVEIRGQRIKVPSTATMTHEAGFLPSTSFFSSGSLSLTMSHC